MGPQYVKKKLTEQGIPVLRVDGDVIWITDRLAVYFSPSMRMSIMRASPVLPRTRWTQLAEERKVPTLAKSLLSFIEREQATSNKTPAQVLDLQAARASRAKAIA